MDAPKQLISSPRSCASRCVCCLRMLPLRTGETRGFVSTQGDMETSATTTDVLVVSAIYHVILFVFTVTEFETV